MTYQVISKSGGGFEVVELRPVVIGAFPDRHIADEFCTYLGMRRSMFDDAVGQFDAGAGADMDGTDDDAPILIEDSETATVVEPVADVTGPADEEPTAQDQAKVTPIFLTELADELARDRAEPARHRQAKKKTTDLALTPELAELRDAYAALDDGGELKAVAATLGISWRSLRGKYAAHCKGRNLQTSPVSARPGPTAERQDCLHCGKAFVASAESEGLCARCARG